MNEENNINNIGLYDPKIENLLKEFSQSRSELSAYMAEVDVIRLKIDGIFPDSADFRNKFVLEEKIKAMSSFFTTLLNIRQEFNKSIKEEIEMRRKLFSNVDDNTTNDDDIREIASIVEAELISKGAILSQQPKPSEDVKDQSTE